MTNTTLDSLLDVAYPICLDIPRQKKHVSIIVHKHKIVSVGMNRFKTHPKAKQIGYMYEEMHSELDAFQKIEKRLLGKKLHLINIRFNQFGDMRMARPCELCMPWCVKVFHTIRFTTNDGFEQLAY